MYWQTELQTTYTCTGKLSSLQGARVQNPASTRLSILPRKFMITKTTQTIRYANDTCGKLDNNEALEKEH